MFTPPFDPRTDPQFRQLLKHVFGSQVQLATLMIMQQQPDYLVLVARLREPRLRVAIKLAGTARPDPEAFARTAALHALVRCQTSLPVAAIIAADASCTAWPWRYSIKLYQPGATWDVVHPRLRGRALETAYADLGAAVGRLHRLRFAAFGLLDRNAVVQPAASLLDGLRLRSARRIQTPRLQALFAEVLARHAALFRAPLPATLAHDDLHRHNLVFAHRAGRWRLTTVLDFDSAWAGPAESDLARLELWTDMVGTGFWPAYTAHNQLMPGYVERRPIYQLLWCLEYAVATPKHLADTQALCRQLGLAPLHDFG